MAIIHTVQNQIIANRCMHVDWYTLASRQVSQGHQKPIANSFDDQTITGVTGNWQLECSRFGVGRPGNEASLQAELLTLLFGAVEDGTLGSKSSWSKSSSSMHGFITVYFTMAKLLVYKVQTHTHTHKKKLDLFYNIETLGLLQPRALAFLNIA